jgi:hypothetical protein
MITLYIPVLLKPCPLKIIFILYYFSARAAIAERK